MRKLKWLLMWLILGILNSGFVNADLEHEFDFISDKNCRNYRHDLSFAIGWSVLLGPLGAAVTPFTTGFYEHGWRLLPREDCAPGKTEAPRKDGQK